MKRLALMSLLGILFLSGMAEAGCLDGTWRWLGDSTGTKPKSGAVVFIRFFGNTAEMVADQPGEHVESSGTYRCSGDKITLSFPDLEGGDYAQNAPFQLRGDQLLLPFPLMSSEKGTSQWRKLKGTVYSKVEKFECPKKDEHGVGIMMCIQGLAGKSVGKDCLYTVTYQDDTPIDKSLGCALNCANASLEPEDQWACSSEDHTCYAKFAGQVIYRNALAMSDKTRSDLLGAYSTIIETLKNNPGIPGDDKPLNPAQMAAADKIQSAKQRIVDLTLTEMIPYDGLCTPQRDQLKWKYPRKYSAPPAVEAAGEVPMQIYAWLKTFELYGSAFYERKDEKTRIALPPEDLAALLIHELIHMRQEQFGFGDGNEARMIPEQTLHEIMAYDISSKTAFYRFFLSPSQRTNLVDTGLQGNINAFRAEWGKVPPKVQQDVAKWAWRTYIWMRSRMLLQPAMHGGVWNLLCAANEGGRFCGMSH